MPVIFTCGQALPVAERPVLITWIQHPSLTQEVRVKPGMHTVPFYEEHAWLQQLALSWEQSALMAELVLTHTNQEGGATIFSLVGPPTPENEIPAYFSKVAFVTEVEAGRQASDAQLEQWAHDLADVTWPLDQLTQPLVRWIAAMHHLATK